MTEPRTATHERRRNVNGPLAPKPTDAQPFVVPNATAAEIEVGLSSWIIQDGNYGDFTVGQHARFALEFGVLDGWKRAAEGPLSAENLGASRYRVRARVAFVADGVSVIDAGAFMAFREGGHDGMQLGELVEGLVYLGIDPFFYFEGLYKTPGMPPLSYQWLIREIQLETTPWRDGKLPNGARIRERDDSKESFTPVAATNAWHDDGGNGHYILRCTRESEPGMP